MDKEKMLDVWCGSRTAGKRKFFWALNTQDFRVYVISEDTNIEEIAEGVDDFIGYPPQGYSWNIQCVGGTKRCQDICERIKRVLMNSAKIN